MSELLSRLNFGDREGAGLEQHNGSETSPGALTRAGHLWKPWTARLTAVLAHRARCSSGRPARCSSLTADGAEGSMAAGLPAGSALDAPAIVQ